MVINERIIWNGLTGTVLGNNGEASVKLITDGESPSWSCKYGGEEKFFEEGKLEQAYGWCKTKVSSNEQRAGK